MPMPLNVQTNFEPIGYIETCFKEKFGTPRQPWLVPSSWGILRLRPELNLSDALVGLDGFSHVWILFVFHQNANKAVKTKIYPPRMNGGKIGLFATRTPHRPNPIGLSAMKLEKIEGNSLYLSGVDLVDGTPVLDIKPYLPSSDRIENTVAGWTTGLPERALEVEFTEEARADLASFYGERDDRAGLAIGEMLSLDPRPNFYKGTSEKPNPYTEVYGLRFDEYNVLYRVDGRLAMVLKLQPWSEFLASWKGGGAVLPPDSDQASQ